MAVLLLLLLLQSNEERKCVGLCFSARVTVELSANARGASEELLPSLQLSLCARDKLEKELLLLLLLNKRAKGPESCC